MNTDSSKRELDIKTLKMNGFLQQVQEDRFSLRIKVVAGQVPAEKLLAVSEIARRYGDGTVHFTSRQAVEVPHIKFDDIDMVRELLAENELEPGILGARVRTITACQGAQVCKHGKINTAELARQLSEATRNIELPHKFKIGITGCCNNCLKAEENDLGIKGGIAPSWHPESCTFCGACAKRCPVAAVAVDKKAGDLVFTEERCISCGRCVNTCPTQAWQGLPGYILYFGGTFGNRIMIGQKLLPLVVTATEVEDLVLKALEFYKTNGKKNERFGFMLKRLGFEKLYQALTT